MCRRAPKEARTSMVGPSSRRPFLFACSLSLEARPSFRTTLPSLRHEDERKKSRSMTQVQRRHQRRRRRSQRHEKNERQAALLSAGSLPKWSVIRDLWREHAEQQTFRIKPLLDKVVAGSRSFLLSLLDGAILK